MALSQSRFFATRGKSSSLFLVYFIFPFGGALIHS